MTVYVNTANKGTLNLRANTSKTSTIVGTIPYGTKLEVERIDETWMKTTYLGKTGYVMNQFLSTEPTTTISKTQLKKVYDSLSNTLKLIEEILK